MLYNNIIGKLFFEPEKKIYYKNVLLYWSQLAREQETETALGDKNVLWKERFEP